MMLFEGIAKNSAATERVFQNLGGGQIQVKTNSCLCDQFMMHDSSSETYGPPQTTTQNMTECLTCYKKFLYGLPFPRNHSSKAS